jgi:hypothetical protein
MGPDLEPDELAQAVDNLTEGGLINDRIMAAIGAAWDRESMDAVWNNFREEWTDVHTEAAKKRLAI